MSYTDPHQDDVKPRTCGHAFLLTATCKECKRWVEDARIARGADPKTGRPHGRS